MTIRALEAFVLRNTETSDLISAPYGQLLVVDDELGALLIADGIAEKYTLVEPTGTETIVKNGKYDVSIKEFAQVNVPTYKASEIPVYFHKKSTDTTLVYAELNVKHIPAYPYVKTITNSEDPTPVNIQVVQPSGISFGALHFYDENFQSVEVYLQEGTVGFQKTGTNLMITSYDPSPVLHIAEAE